MSATKHFRILVAIELDGNWEAESYFLSDAEARKQFDDIMGGLGIPLWGRYGVEANVPVSVPTEGTVTPEETTPLVPANGLEAG